MEKHDSTLRPVRGVLNRQAERRPVTLIRCEPSRQAAPYVENYWHVAWDVPPGEDFETKVLSNANFHLVFEEPEAMVYGVQDVFTRRISGRGQVLGIKFTPGGFTTLVGGSASELTGRRVPAREYFGAAATESNRRILAETDTATMAAAAEDFLRPHLPSRPDPSAVRTAQIVARIVDEPALRRVDAVAAEFDVSVRTLQRLFARHVGVSPKWVLRRSRLHEAAAQAESGAQVDWARLALDLGYTDQAHLTRDFTAAVGAPPARYARS